MFYSCTRRRHPKIFIAIMCYSTYLIKLQLFQLILPTVISALKGLADLKKRKKREKRKERGQKSQKKMRDNQVLILRIGRYVVPNE